LYESRTPKVPKTPNMAAAPVGKKIEGVLKERGIKGIKAKPNVQ